MYKHTLNNLIVGQFLKKYFCNAKKIKQNKEKIELTPFSELLFMRRHNHM